MATIGTKDFSHYRGVATNQGSYKYYFNVVGTKVSGHYREVATHQGWPLKGVPLYTQQELIIKYTVRLTNVKCHSQTFCIFMGPPQHLWLLLLFDCRYIHQK